MERRTTSLTQGVHRGQDEVGALMAEAEAYARRSPGCATLVSSIFNRAGLGLAPRFEGYVPAEDRSALAPFTVVLILGDDRRYDARSAREWTYIAHVVGCAEGEGGWATQKPRVQRGEDGFARGGYKEALAPV